MDETIKEVNFLQIEKTRVEWLYRQSVAAQTSGLINAALYAFLSIGLIETSSLIIWASSIFCLYMLRVSFQTYFNHNHIKKLKPFDPKFWEFIFVLSTFLSGAAWGVAGSLLLPTGNVLHHTFLGFLLAGTTAGAAIAYCASKKAVHAFLLPALVPFGIRLFIEGGRYEYGMCALLFFFLVLLTVLVRRMHTYIVDSIRLSFEKDHLIQTLKETQAKMMYSAKMSALGEMAGGISHEINNPLTVILGRVHQLEEALETNRFDQKELHKITSTIAMMVERVSKIIKGLRSFAREGKNDPREFISVKKLLTEVLEFCQTRFENHAVDLVMEDGPSDIVLECRSVQITQVILNLLNNAFDAVVDTEDAWVRVAVREESGNAIFTITDSGNGIPEELREKIMQPFFTTKSVGKGTGLGLSVSKGIIESHGGVLYLDSNARHTCFIVSLPRAFRDPEKSVA